MIFDRTSTAGCRVKYYEGHLYRVSTQYRDEPILAVIQDQWIDVWFIYQDGQAVGWRLPWWRGILIIIGAGKILNR